MDPDLAPQPGAQWTNPDVAEQPITTGVGLSGHGPQPAGRRADQRLLHLGHPRQEKEPPPRLAGAETVTFLD